MKQEKINGSNFALLLCHTLLISIIENPPIKSAEADPETCSCSSREAEMESDMSGFMPSNLGTECTKCSGVYGKNKQYELPESRSSHGFTYLQLMHVEDIYKNELII